MMKRLLPLLFALCCACTTPACTPEQSTAVKAEVKQAAIDLGLCTAREVISGLPQVVSTVISKNPGWDSTLTGLLGSALGQDVACVVQDLASQAVPPAVPAPAPGPIAARASLFSSRAPLFSDAPSSAVGCDASCRAAASRWLLDRSREGRITGVSPR